MRILAILTACLALAACGDDERPAAAAITIENKLGSVEIRERPVRVVALDFPLLSIPYALDALVPRLAEAVR